MNKLNNVLLILVLLMAAYIVLMETTKSDAIDSLGVAEETSVALQREIDSLRVAIETMNAQHKVDSISVVTTRIDSSLLELALERSSNKKQFHEEISSLRHLPFDAKLRLVSDHLSSRDSAAWRYIGDSQ